MKKSVRWFFGSVLLVAGIWLCVQISRYGGLVTRRVSQGEVQVVDVLPLINVFRAHADFPRLLFFRKQRFGVLQGRFPYFIEVPQLHSILFLIGTAEQPESALVLLDLDSGEPIYIPMGGIVIGTYGFGGKDKDSIHVVYADHSKVILEDARGFEVKREAPLTYELNIGLKTITCKNEPARQP